jgi:hypothetical protein
MKVSTKSIEIRWYSGIIVGPTFVKFRTLLASQQQNEKRNVQFLEKICWRMQK